MTPGRLPGLFADEQLARFVTRSSSSVAELDALLAA